MFKSNFDSELSLYRKNFCYENQTFKLSVLSSTFATKVYHIQTDMPRVVEKTKKENANLNCVY